MTIKYYTPNISESRSGSYKVTSFSVNLQKVSKYYIMRSIMLAIFLISFITVKCQIMAEVSITNDSTVLLRAWPDITGKGIHPYLVGQNWKIFTTSREEYEIEHVIYSNFSDLQIRVDSSFTRDWTYWNDLVLLYKEDPSGKIPLFPVAGFNGRSNIELHAAVAVENLVRKLEEELK